MPDGRELTGKVMDVFFPQIFTTEGSDVYENLWSRWEKITPDFVINVKGYSERFRIPLSYITSIDEVAKRRYRSRLNVINVKRQNKAVIERMKHGSP